MRTIPNKDDLDADVLRLKELLTVMGRRRSLRDPVAAAVEELNLTPPQVHAILWLGADGAMTMGDIAHRCGISEKTVTGVVDRLQKAGYVLRERDEQDRRVVRCHLSKAGDKVYRQLDALVTQAMTLFLGAIDREDRKDFLRILEKFQKALAMAPVSAAAPNNKKDKHHDR